MRRCGCMQAPLAQQLRAPCSAAAAALHAALASAASSRRRSCERSAASWSQTRASIVPRVRESWDTACSSASAKLPAAPARRAAALASALRALTWLCRSSTCGVAELTRSGSALDALERCHVAVHAQRQCACLPTAQYPCSRWTRHTCARSAQLDASRPAMRHCNSSRAACSCARAASAPAAASVSWSRGRGRHALLRPAILAGWRLIPTSYSALIAEFFGYAAQSAVSAARLALPRGGCPACSSPGCAVRLRHQLLPPAGADAHDARR